MDQTTKKLLGPADYQLLFIRINSIHDDYIEQKDEMWRIFDYEHVKNRWKPSDHAFSPDKKALDNCYMELAQDKYYLILAYRASNMSDQVKGRKYYRWIWRACSELSEKNIRKAYDYYLLNSADIRGCVKFAHDLNNPTMLPAVEEFDYAK